MKTADPKAVVVNFMREFCEGMKTLDVDPAKSNPGDFPLFPVYFKVSPPDDDLVTKSGLQTEVEIGIHSLDPPNALDIKPVQPLFWLMSLVIQAAVQDTGRVLDRKTNFHMSGAAMRCLPSLYASDAANSLLSWVSLVVLSRMGVRRAATEILKRRNPGPSVHGNGDEWVRVLTKLKAGALSRWAYFVASGLPFFVKLYFGTLTSRLVYLRTMACLNVGSWLFFELLVMAATVEGHLALDPGAKEETTSQQTNSGGETSAAERPQGAALAPGPIPQGTPALEVQTFPFYSNIITVIIPLTKVYQQHLIPVVNTVAKRLGCVANGALDACTHDFLPPRGSFTEPGGVLDMLTASSSCICIYAAARAAGEPLGLSNLGRPPWVPTFLPTATNLAWLIAAWAWILQALHLSLRISHGEGPGGYLEDFVSGSVVIVSLVYLFAKGRGIFKRVDITSVAWVFVLFQSLLPWVGYLP